MLELIIQFWAVVFSCIVLLHIYSAVRFFRIVEKEKPEWLEAQSSLSIFCTGLPRYGDPNVQVKLIKIIYSSRIEELSSPMAFTYAKRVRVLLPVGVLLFVMYLLVVLITAP